MDDVKSKELDGEFSGLTVSEAARAYKEMADSILATMYALVADELVLRTRNRPPDRPVRTVLDIGTGMGHLAAQLRAKFADPTVVALDLSPAILAEAVALGGLPRGILPLAGDVTKLPVRNGTVDVVATYGAFHHVPDKTGFFSEIYRALAPDGLALIIDLNREAHQAVIDIIAAHLSKPAAGAFLESMDEAATPAEVEKIARSAGVADCAVTTSPISRRAVAMNADALRAAPLKVPPTAIIWGAYITKAGS